MTHNGVDTHPIHFHLYDVQVLNRVTWDNIIIPPDKEELGWKDTVRMAPLEDTIVALRAVVPELPFEIPNAIRNLNPMDPARARPISSSAWTCNGNPLPNPITNQLINQGWGYVWHCHILSHEEMDMMRPQTLALPPVAPIRPRRHAQRRRHQPDRVPHLGRQLHHRDGVRGAALRRPGRRPGPPSAPWSRRSTRTTRTARV